MPVEVVATIPLVLYTANTRVMRKLRNTLREATRDHHDRVDAQFGAFDLSSADAYRRFVSIHASIVVPLEQELTEFGIANFLADWPSRRRARALTEDLRDLGLNPLAAKVPSHFCTSLPRAAGTLYVLEGSRLGNREIFRRLSKTRNDFPTRYLRHGTEVQLWREFVQWMNGQAWGSDEIEDAIGCARATFSLFEWAAASQCGTGPRPPYAVTGVPAMREIN